MADIFVTPNSVVNTNTIPTDSEILGLYEVLATSVVNTNSVTNISSVNFTLNPTSVVNTNSVTNISSVDFVIPTGSTVNTNKVSSVGYIDFNTIKTFADSVVNTNTVSDLSAVTISFKKLPTSIVNDNKVSNIDGIGIGTFYRVDSVINQNRIPQPTIIAESIPVAGGIVSRVAPNRTKIRDYVFSDLAFDFLPHPLTGDIAVLYDTDAINQSLENILKTQRYERPFEEYTISSSIRSLLFELSSSFLQVELESEIYNTIVDNEPRISILDNGIKVEDITKNNALKITIMYRVKTFDKVEEFSTILARN